jgi:hypothetical protein
MCIVERNVPSPPMEMSARLFLRKLCSDPQTSAFRGSRFFKTGWKYTGTFEAADHAFIRVRMGSIRFDFLKATTPKLFIGTMSPPTL